MHGLSRSISSPDKDDCTLDTVQLPQAGATWLPETQATSTTAHGIAVALGGIFEAIRRRLPLRPEHALGLLTEKQHSALTATIGSLCVNCAAAPTLWRPWAEVLPDLARVSSNFFSSHSANYQARAKSIMRHM